ncbi:MAG: HDOD domain-containing protein [Deltaproteobacteria bacterium]|nr:HDOD domain-containing protein [Deltaproteobacteria bacterium]
MMDRSESPDRVLVVDDDEQTRRVLERSLRRLGYDITLAANGAEGLRLALEVRPHVILSDIRMPELDGHTLLRRLGAQGVESVVIVMSAHGDMDDVIDVLRNGAVDYLRKPWAPAELMAAIERAIEVYHQRRQGRAAKEAEAPAAPGPAADKPAGPDQELVSLLDQVRRGEITLPPFPPVLQELRALLSHADTPMSEITALVERDPRLAAQVLRVVNSAHYARGSRITGIGMAVGRIGLRQLQSLVNTIVVGAAHQAKDPVLRKLQARIWRYSVTRAVSMRALAELVGGQLDPETAYAAGLLGDVGALFLLWLLGERAATSSRSPSDAETYLATLRAQHHETGAALLERWQMDAAVVEIARNHHLETPPAPPSPYWSLAILAVAMADKLTTADDPTRTSAPSAELIDRCGADLRIGTSVVQKILESVRRELAAVTDIGPV